MVDWFRGDGALLSTSPWREFNLRNDLTIQEPSLLPAVLLLPRDIWQQSFHSFALNEWCLISSLCTEPQVWPLEALVCHRMLCFAKKVLFLGFKLLEQSHFRVSSIWTGSAAICNTCFFKE